MTSSVKVPWETRLGDIGEARIRSLLSYFSIPTKYTRDVGIDFYCELLEEDSPSVPFYVQAKGTQHFNEDWGSSVKKSTVRYWLQQSFPVFLIVYDENTGNSYWMSVEDYRYGLIDKILKPNGETIYLKMDRSHVLEEEKNKNAEFTRKIKEGVVSIELFRGRPLPKGEGYVKRIPNAPRSKIEFRRIKENIRQSLYSLLIYHFLRGDLENAHFLCKFLTRFDKSHYNHFVWFGQINKALGRKTEAKRNYEEALRICERDKNWPRESMEEIIAKIRKEMESCE